MAVVEFTLEQIRNATLQVPDACRQELLEEIERVRSADAARAAALKPHSILDIPPVRLRRTAPADIFDDDLLGEMLKAVHIHGLDTSVGCNRSR